MRDRFGREVDYLRLSVTEGCNMRCIYCRPQAASAAFTHDVPSCRENCRIASAREPSCGNPSAERCIEIVEAAAQLGIRKVRITGGEPCVRTDLPEIARGIAAVPGIEEVCLTTNGTLIAPMAAALKAAGLARVNVSIDSLDQDRYREITRGGSLAAALEGLDALAAAGFEGTKVNCVLMPGINDDEVEGFGAFAAERGIGVRFIELMPIGPARELNPYQQPLPLSSLSPIAGKPAKGNRPQLQVIAPISAPFCSQCNRIRVTADEQAKPCLHSREELSLRGLSGDELVDALRAAILAKPAGHNLASGASESARDMSRIGG